MTDDIIHDALDQLRGAVTIVYPMNLPPHDPIRLEFEGQEDLSETQVKYNTDFLNGRIYEKYDTYMQTSHLNYSSGNVMCSLSAHAVYANCAPVTVHPYALMELLVCAEKTK